MKEVRLTPAALADVAGIRRYTRSEWGVDQANAYLGGLGERFREIAAGEGVARQQLGYAYARYRSQVIFFRAPDDHVRIVRVIQDRMDVPSHLQQDS